MIETSTRCPACGEHIELSDYGIWCLERLVRRRAEDRIVFGDPQPPALGRRRHDERGQRAPPCQPGSCRDAATASALQFGDTIHYGPSEGQKATTP